MTSTFLSFSGLIWPFWAHLRHSGPIWAIWASSEAHLGLIWATLASFGLIWAILDSSGQFWLHLGLIWGSSGPFWRHLGLIWAIVGSSEPFWPHLDDSGLISSILRSDGPFAVHSELFWGQTHQSCICTPDSAMRIADSSMLLRVCESNFEW